MSTTAIVRRFANVPEVSPELKSALSDASILRAKIYDELGRIGVAEGSLEHSYIRLGSMLTEFKRAEYWRDLNASDGQGYKNFDAFMLELRDRYNRGRTQLWAYLSVAEKLLPSISAQTLDEIGISKAQELKRMLKHAPGRRHSDQVVETAKNPKTTIKELRAVLHETYELGDDDRPAGQWFDFGGAYLTPDERKEFLDFVKVAVRKLGLTKETPDWIQRKECLLVAAREFFGTHAADVYGPQNEVSSSQNEVSDGNHQQ